MAVRHSVRIETRFSATHQVRLSNGALEPPHGHDWIVRVHIARRGLDELDMVVDFEQARVALDTLLSPLQYTNLNGFPDFADRNPTAETVAEWILSRLRTASLPNATRVEVTESPGCVAIAETLDP